MAILSVCALISLSSLVFAADSPWPASFNLSSYNNVSAIANSTNSTNYNNSTSSNWNPSDAFNPGTNARIPSSISSSCQAFLARLNSNSQVKACTAPLMNATSSFSSGASSITPDQVQSAFDGLCGPSSGEGCQTGLFHEILGHFSGNCSYELNSGDPAIRATYDVIYIMTPFKRALCAQDPSTGKYCPTTIASAVINASPDAKNPGASSNDFRTMIGSLLPSGKLVTQLGSSSLTKRDLPIVGSLGHEVHGHVRRDHASIAKAAHLHHRADGNLTNTFNTTFNSNSMGNNNTNTQSNNTNTQPNNPNDPDPTTFTTTNLAFLFLSPSLPSSALCTPCTVSVLASYIAFEQSTPHYGGLAASGFLSGQVRLWKGIIGKCGDDFAKSISDRAGIVEMQTTSGAAEWIDHSSMGSMIGFLIFSIGISLL